MSDASSTSPFSAPSWSTRSCTAGNRSNSPRHVSPNSSCRSTGPISAACWRAVKERPSIECVQARAWHLLIERFGFPERGDCINARQRKKAKASPLEASMSRSLVSSRLTFAAKPAPFVPVAAEGTRETDWLPEGTGFEPSVPRQEKWSMPSFSDQTRVGRTLTLGGGAESSLEGRDIELSVSPKDIRTSPYDLCANRSDRRQSREGDRWFESTSLQR